MEECRDGYKFAIAFLAITGSILYKIIDYFGNVAVESRLYILGWLTISIGFTVVLYFLIYLLIKGFSMEAEENEIEYLNKKAKNIYIFNMFLFLFLILLIMFIFIAALFYPPPAFPPLSLFFIFFLIFSLFLILLFPFRLIKLLMSIKFSFFLGFNAILISIIFLYAVLFFPVGYITLDMKEIYHKTDVQIPAQIQLTGYNTGLNVTLYKEKTGHLYEVANISHISPINWQNKVIYNEFLLANYLGKGRYLVFINTSDLNTGYYELWIEREYSMWLKPERKGFYLLNNSQQS